MGSSRIARPQWAVYDFVRLPRIDDAFSIVIHDKFVCYKFVLLSFIFSSNSYFLWNSVSILVLNSIKLCEVGMINYLNW